MYKKIKNCTAGHVRCSCCDSMGREKQKATIKKGIMRNLETAAKRQAVALRNKIAKRAKSRQLDEVEVELDALEGNEEEE